MISRRLRGVRVVALVSAAAALAFAPAAPADAAGSESAAGSRRLELSPKSGLDLATAMCGLAAGDTLALAPGTFDIGEVNVPLFPKCGQGAPGAPITVTAADPANPPLLLGRLYFQNPQYFVVDHLRIESNIRLAPAITVVGGTGWSITNNELWGARSTAAFGNVLVKNSDGRGALPGPTGFSITGNCIHDASPINTTAGYHNIYVQFAGNAATSGTISRNLIYNHPAGSGIKLGPGGGATQGPWNVSVVNNTILRGAEQITLSQDVRANAINGNLMGVSTAKFSNGSLNNSTGVFGASVRGPGNVLTNNYVFKAARVLYDRGGRIRLGPGNGVRPDPGLTSIGCGGAIPTGARATAYGYTGQGPFPRWATSATAEHAAGRGRS